MAKKSFYYYMRNGLWTIWMHKPQRKLVKRTVGHLYAYFLRSLKHGYATSYVKGIIDAIRGLPNCIGHKVVVAPYWEIKAQ
ncbi:MAG: hypothetical protein FGF51_01515 [Candidatus Brockarchaeota archaeon]|nr:hypothetical protein [Candidatus Brockarchaeota archaeon]